MHTTKKYFTVIAGLGLAVSGFAPMMAAPTIAYADGIASIEQEAARTIEVNSIDALVKAIDDTPSDGTVTKIVLTASITDDTSGGIDIAEGKSVTIDLNGNTLTLNSKATFDDPENADNDFAGDTAIVNYGMLIVTGKGTITSETVGDVIQNYGTFSSDKQVQVTNIATSADKDGVTSTFVNIGGTATLSGTTIKSTFNQGISVYGGNVTLDGARVSTIATGTVGVGVFNRNADNDSAPAHVVITGGTNTNIDAAGIGVSTNNTSSKGSSVIIDTTGFVKGGEVGVYWPSSGALTIGKEDGTGPRLESNYGTAVEVCCGTVDIYGGTFTGGKTLAKSKGYTADQAGLDKIISQGGMALDTGDALLVIANRGGGYDMTPVDVNIHGGKFTSSHDYDIRFVDGNLATEPTGATSGASMSVSDATFAGGDKYAKVHVNVSDNIDEGIFDGGTYSAGDVLQLYRYVDDGYVIARTGDAVDDEGDNAYSIVNVDDLDAANYQYSVVDGDGNVIAYIRSDDENESKALLAATNDGAVEQLLYHVTFNPMLANVAPTIIDVPNGTRLVDVETPTFECDGYEFGGWYIDEECTVPSDLSTMDVRFGDVQLYARWISDSEQPVEDDDTNDDTADDETPILQVNDDGESHLDGENKNVLADDGEDGGDTIASAIEEMMQTGVSMPYAATGFGAIIAAAGAALLRFVSKR